MKKRVFSFIVTIVLISYIGFNYEYFETLLTRISDAAKEVVSVGMPGDGEASGGSAVAQLESEMEGLDAKKFFYEEETSSAEEGSSEGDSYSHKQNLDGLNEVRKHLTNDVDGFDFEPNKAMMEKIKEMLSNNQELTGAYKDFYEHELTESMLMKQGYGYNDAHNMALEIHNVQPQALYSPEIVQEFSKWFNKSDYEYWGITIKK